MSLWDVGRSGTRSPKVRQYQWKLDERLFVTIDANGNGSGQLSPQGARERWTINFVAVTVTGTPPTSQLVPQMVLYRSAAVPGNQLAGTYNASLDADTQGVYNLNMSEPILFVFSGGFPGSVGNVHIEGIRYVWE